MPKISVIIPVYNTEQFLHKCLDSVINQTFKDIEIICIDDGSTDNSLSILKEYAKIDNRIKILTQKNKGAGIARNKGLEISQGEYLYFLDSDDYVLPEIFTKMYEQISFTHSDICLCNYYEKDEINNITSLVPIIKLKYIKSLKTFSPKDFSKKIFQISGMACFTKLYKRSFIIENNIDFQDVKICNDVFFNLITLATANKITYINEPLMVYLLRQKNSLSSSRGNYTECLVQVINKTDKYLKEKQLFKIFENSFYSKCIECINYELNLCTDKKKIKLIKQNFSKIIPKKYWYFNIFKIFIQKLFSITNEYRDFKKYKIITILGIKIKFKKGENKNE